MLAFARAAPRGAAGSCRSGSPTAAACGRGRRPGLTATVRVTLLAAVNAKALRVRIAAGAGRPCATVRTTTAPALAARTGVADRPARTVCPRGRALALTVPGPSLTVATLPAP